MEVLRRSSKDLDALQRLKRLTRHLERPGIDGRPDRTPLPRADYQPYKLSQRLPGETVAAILAMYENGATTRQVGERFNLAHSSIIKLLRRYGVRVRRRGPRTANPKVSTTRPVADAGPVVSDSSPT